MKGWLASRRRRVGIAVLCVVALGGYVLYARIYSVLPDSAIHLLDDVNLPSAGERLLVISPHPDDETIACGGYIFLSLQRGASVAVVVVTDGNKRGIGDRRHLECRRATAILGIQRSELEFLEFPETKLKGEREPLVEAALSAAYRRWQPQFLLYPDPLDHHPDHAVVGRLVEEILKKNPGSATAYSYLVHHRKFPQPKLLRMENDLLPPVSMVAFDKQWRRLMLPREALDRKHEAVLAYRSQLRVPFLRSLLLSFIRANELFSIPRLTNSEDK